MSDLTRRLFGAEPEVTSGRWLNREKRQVFRDTVVAALQAEGAAAVSGRIMERIVDLDHERQMLARGDQLLNELLMEVELGYVRKGLKIQSQVFSPFKF